MIKIDSVAQRFPQNDGRDLIDYFPVYLPCQILYLDALLIDRHPLPSPIEFTLKAIQIGITIPEEIAGFLGFTPVYSKKLIDQLKNEDYVSADFDGNIKILKRGTEALTQHGERILKDKTIPVLWDTVTETPIQARPELFSDKDKDIQSVKIKFPSIVKTPNINNIDVASIQNYRRAIRDVDEEYNREDILRLVSVRKVIHRWREVIILLYENNKSLPIVKIAVNGQIDNTLSSHFAQKDGGKYLGINNQFSRKSGALAVEDRYSKLMLKAAQTPLYLSQRRGVLIWKLSSIKDRFEENKSQELEDQYKTSLTELNEIESKLSEIPVRAMNCVEMQLTLLDALSSAKKSLIITTTNPNNERFSADLIHAFTEALNRNIKIGVYISDKTSDSFNTHNRAIKTPISRLNDLQVKYPQNLKVLYLKQSPRPVYEICWDGVELAFANDSTLGSRPEHGKPRGFKGYRVSGNVVSQYINNYLTFSESDLLKQVRLQKNNKPFNKNKKKAGLKK